MATLVEWLGWLRGVEDLSGWAQAVATLITGILAIAAGRLAFRGAKMQAEATLNSQAIQLEQQRRAIACGLLAETLEAHARLVANIHHLPKAKPDELFGTVFIPLDLGFYQANLGDIGILKPDLVLSIMGGFKRALRFQADLDRLGDKGLRLDQVANQDAIMRNAQSLAKDLEDLSLEFVSASGLSRDEIKARAKKNKDFTPRGQVGAGSFLISAMM